MLASRGNKASAKKRSVGIVRARAKNRKTDWLGESRGEKKPATIVTQNRLKPQDNWEEKKQKRTQVQTLLSQGRTKVAQCRVSAGASHHPLKDKRKDHTLEKGVWGASCQKKGGMTS